MKKQKNGNGEGSFRIVNGKYNYRFTYINEFGEKKESLSRQSPKKNAWSKRRISSKKWKRKMQG